MRLARTAKASVWIDAPPEAIWNVVVDVTRGGEWSGESLGCEWLNGASGARPGARFKGRNKRHGLRWSKVNEVIRADRPHEFVWRTLPTPLLNDSGEWRIILQEEGGGTRVTEELRILSLSPAADVLFYWLMPEHRDRSADIAGDLERLKTLVERGSAPKQQTTA